MGKAASTGRVLNTNARHMKTLPEFETRLGLHRRGNGRRRFGPVLCVALLLPALFAAGCKKAENTPSAPDRAGMLDVEKLQKAFPPPRSDNVQHHFQNLVFSVRFRNYSQALEALYGLAAEPGVTDAQKKVVNELIEEVKQAQGGAASKPAPAP